MLKEFVDILTGKHPMQRASDRFNEMYRLALDMVGEASAVYWGRVLTPSERTALYEKDVRVNKLQRRIRKRVIANLSNPVSSDVPFCLLMMSLVKDVERIGDYAKNLIEVPALCGKENEGVAHALPDDAITAELKQIAQSIEAFAREAGGVYERSDRDRARELTLEGRAVAKRCDKLISQIVKADYAADIAVDLTLGTRFYKRIDAHILNLMSSLLMPLHKLDYYDEKAVID